MGFWVGLVCVGCPGFWVGVCRVLVVSGFVLGWLVCELGGGSRGFGALLFGTSRGWFLGACLLLFGVVVFVCRQVRRYERGS